MHFVLPDELCDILCHHRPLDADVELYREYIIMLMGVFGAACKDVRELRHVVSLFFSVVLVMLLQKCC